MILGHWGNDKLIREPGLSGQSLAGQRFAGGQPAVVGERIQGDIDIAVLGEQFSMRRFSAELDAFRRHAPSAELRAETLPDVVLGEGPVF
jgi:hypothetical protein